MPTASHPEGDTEDWEMLLAGYRACASEAIRFLTEEESVPVDSPLVLGLWQHLLAQESQLDLVSSAPAEGDSGLNLSDVATPNSPHRSSSPVRIGPCHITDTDSFAQPYPSPQHQKGVGDQLPSEGRSAEESDPGDETISRSSDSDRTDHRGRAPVASQYSSSPPRDPTGSGPVPPPTC